jgi:hypothetical protein
MIQNPQPSWLPLILLALPGIAFAAFAVNQVIFPCDERPLSTVPVIGIVVALLPTHVLSLISGSLTIGLAVAWSLLGTAGYAWIIRHWRQLSSSLLRNQIDLLKKLGITALATTPIILPTILANFSDEVYFNGHDAIIAQLQNGVYPPRYLYEPNLPLRYHYGFDLAGAIVTGLVRLRLDQAIDLLTLALWPCMFLVLCRLGKHVGGKQASLFVALAVCFAGGWPIIAVLGSSCAVCTQNGLQINPPFIHYYFQHPWSLGVPIFCLAVLQRAALPRLDKQVLGLAVFACSMLLLSLAHTVLFVTTVAALGLTDAWRFIREHDSTAGKVLFTLAITMLTTKLIGGFFVSGPFPPAGGIFGTGFSLNQWSSNDAILGQMQWNLGSFGIILFLGFVGLLRARQEKEFLTIFSGVSLVITNTLRYKYSWDIVKFGTVAFIGLAIGTGILLSDLAVWANRFRRRLVYVLLIVAVGGQGVLYPYPLTFASYNPNGREPFSTQIIRPYFSFAYPVNPDDARAVNFLRTHMAPSDIVYRAEDKSEPYAIWGGLPTQASVYAANGNDDVYGLGEEKLAGRRDLARVSEDWFDRLAVHRVNWLVTDVDDKRN